MGLGSGVAAAAGAGYQPDPDGTLSPATADPAKLIPLGGPSLVLPAMKGPVWVYLPGPFPAADLADGMLAGRYPRTDRMTVYAQGADGQTREIGRDGIQVREEDGGGTGAAMAVPLRGLPADLAGFWLRLESRTPIVIDHQVMSRRAWDAIERRSAIIGASSLGIMVTMLALMGLLYAAFRSHTEIAGMLVFLSLILSVTATGNYSASFGRGGGLMASFGLQNISWIGILVFGGLLASWAVNFDRWYPRLYRLVVALLVTMPVITVAAWALEDRFIQLALGVLSVSVPTVVLVICVLAARSGEPLAMLFLGAWTPLLTGAFIYNASLIALMPWNPDLVDLYQIGAMISGVLFTACFADRFRRMLETRVAARTTELTARTAQLETLSADLRAERDRAEAAFTRLRDTQDHLIQSEKLAGLGGLVAGVAHEINTPIGIAVTAVSHLADETRRINESFAAGTLKRSELQSYLDTASETAAILMANSQRAADLVTSFKLVAADQTSEDRRRYDLLAYAREVVLSLRPEIARTGHAVEVSGQDGVILDGPPGAVAQVITNLIGNALIHAFPAGQKGQISLMIDAQGPGMARLTVEDNGKGIATEILPRIFDPFFTTRRGAGGTGLGLHIVHNLVVRTLGGSVSVARRPEGGTRFAVRLPRIAPAQDAA